MNQNNKEIIRGKEIFDFKDIYEAEYTPEYFDIFCYLRFLV
jgi:hypothetical protein